MKKEFFSISVLVCLIALGLSACSSKPACPPCQTSLGQPQYMPQAMPAEESMASSRRTAIK